VRIRVNGEEYASWDDVPEEMRRLLARVMPDDDHDGVPDAFQRPTEPGQHTYHRRFTATTRVTHHRVLPSEDRPGFRFDTADTFARALPLTPEGRQEADPESSPPPSTAPSTDGPIVLNGVEVAADGSPLKKKRWWSRG
jgi:hypothetical protein